MLLELVSAHSLQSVTLECALRAFQLPSSISVLLLAMSTEVLPQSEGLLAGDAVVNLSGMGVSKPVKNKLSENQSQLLRKKITFERKPQFQVYIVMIINCIRVNKLFNKVFGFIKDNIMVVLLNLP